MYVADRPTSPPQRHAKGLALIGASAVAVASIGLMPQVAQLPDPAKVSYQATQLVAQVDPFETLFEALQKTATNLQTVANNWQARPAPLAQQIAANWLSYGNTITKSLTSEIATIDRIGGQLTDPAFVEAFIGNLEQGNIEVAWRSVYTKLVVAGMLLVGPLSNIGNIPAHMLTNMAAAVKVLAGSGLSAVGTGGVSALLGTGTAIAHGLQGAVDSAKEGDALGTVQNVANIPGLWVEGVLNNSIGGVTSPTGLLGQLTTRIPQLIAAGVISPGAQNIFKGGTLEAGAAALSDSFDKLVAAIGASMGLPAAPKATVNAVAAPKALAAGAMSDPASVPALTAPAVSAVTLDVAADTAPRVATKAVADESAADVDADADVVKSVTSVKDSPAVVTPSAPKVDKKTAPSSKLATKLKEKVADKFKAKKSTGSSASDASTGASNKASDKASNKASDKAGGTSKSKSNDSE